LVLAVQIQNAMEATALVDVIEVTYEEQLNSGTASAIGDSITSGTAATAAAQNAFISVFRESLRGKIKHNAIIDVRFIVRDEWGDWG